ADSAARGRSDGGADPRRAAHPPPRPRQRRRPAPSPPQHEGAARMTRVGDWMPLISAANRALRLDFPRKPFAIRHTLAGDALLTVARARGCNSLLDAGFEQLEGRLLVSSPNATPPLQIAQRDSFLVQIDGESSFTVFDNTDRGIVSDDEIERAVTLQREPT